MRSLLPASDPKLTARLIELTPGVHLVEPGPRHRLILHRGDPVLAASACEQEHTSLHVQREGDMDFIPAGSAGRWLDQGPSTVLALSLCHSVFTEAARRLGRSPRHIRPKPRLAFRDDRLASLARLAPLETESSTPGSAAFGEALARAMAVHILGLEPRETADPARIRPLEGRRLRAVMTYIDTHLDEALTLDALAREAGLKRSHFAAAFRLATGRSPHQFVIERRIDAARQLLLGGEMSISEVAFQTGFAHQSHLSRALRKLTGQTPRDLRGLSAGAPRRLVGAATVGDPASAGEDAGPQSVGRSSAG